MVSTLAIYFFKLRFHFLTTFDPCNLECLVLLICVSRPIGPYHVIGAMFSYL